MPDLEPKTCAWCQHSLKDNSHGPDQNDFVLDEDEALVPRSDFARCTYCRVCRRLVVRILEDRR